MKKKLSRTKTSRRLMIVACVLTGGLAAAVWSQASTRSEQNARNVPTSFVSGEVSKPSSSAQETDAAAGEIFGTPVSLGNYYFAKRIAYLFPRPWGAADLPEEEREAFIWEQLILHFESFRRNIAATEDEVTSMVNTLLRNQDQSFTRHSDPEAYRQWAMETLNEDVELLENQIRYLIQIRKLRDQVLEELRVTVTEEAMQNEFLNEKHHVGGEIVVFKTQEEAQAFYERVRDPAQWEAMKAEGAHQVRPVSLMTLEAYIDLWSIPKPQMYAFHALEIGSIGPPMPFGRDWCVYRLLDKRTGDLQEFPRERDSYYQQVEMKEKYAALKQWIEELKQRANLNVLLDENPPGNS